MPVHFRRPASWNTTPSVARNFSPLRSSLQTAATRQPGAAPSNFRLSTFSIRSVKFAPSVVTCLCRLAAQMVRSLQMSSPT
ncbi:hypothetical protein ATCV1_z817L [Acanthocystis turfacea chlorella virus 1]|uniref:Uncharacterized protein z817L n=1 Tax=Chlorovirus heliozoae TaxID=322019 RepID=A7KA77_9PHYC|nr:hypothetical protein ATCV1_z817L [Acanthocystis turfacea chlorella virus 1]ABT16951.1 hypothetical protein ATCV1_z817L [Acanthocystis turfacea chlorella virus 1]